MFLQSGSPISPSRLPTRRSSNRVRLAISSPADGISRFLDPRALRRANVLVHPEEVSRIVLLLDRGQTVVVLAEGGSHALLALLHHEVDIGASGRVRVQGVE